MSKLIINQNKKKIVQDKLISIILPVRNSERYLYRCLESISSQTYRNFEVLAIDDLSTDLSHQILKDWTKKDKRIKVFKNKKHYGVGVCFNRGMKKAKGHLVTFMNSKDVLSKTRFKAQIGFLSQNPKTVAVGTQSAYINYKNKRHGESNFPIAHNSICKNLLPGKSMQFESAMINRTLIPKDLLKFPTQTKSLLLRELFLKLTNYGELANLPQVLHFKRIELAAQKTRIAQLPSLLKLLVKTTALEEYQSPFSFILQPLVKSKN